MFKSLKVLIGLVIVILTALLFLPIIILYTLYIIGNEIVEFLKRRD
jgi:hypothetical protein